MRLPILGARFWGPGSALPTQKERKAALFRVPEEIGQTNAGITFLLPAPAIANAEEQARQVGETESRHAEARGEEDSAEAAAGMNDEQVAADRDHGTDDAGNRLPDGPCPDRYNKSISQPEESKERTGRAR